MRRLSVDKESENIIKQTLKEISLSTTIIIVAHKSNLIQSSIIFILLRIKKFTKKEHF